MTQSEIDLLYALLMKACQNSAPREYEIFSQALQQVKRNTINVTKCPVLHANLTDNEYDTVMSMQP